MHAFGSHAHRSGVSSFDFDKIPIPLENPLLSKRAVDVCSISNLQRKLRFVVMVFWSLDGQSRFKDLGFLVPSFCVDIERSKIATIQLALCTVVTSSITGTTIARPSLFLRTTSKWHKAGF
jgi:hypothetical protein